MKPLFTGINITDPCADCGDSLSDHRPGLSLCGYITPPTPRCARCRCRLDEDAPGPTCDACTRELEAAAFLIAHGFCNVTLAANGAALAIRDADGRIAGEPDDDDEQDWCALAHGETI
jgi:hypothetical protein